MIRIRNFCKRYDGFVAVRGLSMDIPAGSIFGFIGPNGAGKTTTIRFLVTLLKPTRGRAHINGFDVVRDVRKVRKSIGYMPDVFGVYNGMRVWEFLDFFSVAYGIPRYERARLVDDILTLVDLHSKRNDLVNALSRGMKQRLCLAKTLVHDPPVLILDEPASGLDPRARIEMMELLTELRAMGKTILISSHILSELSGICDVVGIMERGELLAFGPIEEIEKTIQDHRVIQATILGESDEVERFFSFHHRINNVEREGREYRFEFSGPDEELLELLGALNERKLKPLWVQEEKQDLDKIFMTITKGRVQ